MRIAIYARYSTDLQNPSSIPDQIALCESHILKEFGSSGPFIVESDAAETGSHMVRRDGLSRIMEKAGAKEIDLVVAEGLDRLSRSPGDTHGIYDLLTFHGVKVFTCQEGLISPVDVALASIVNSMQLTQLKDKTRRALIARAKAGFVAAGRTYGYKVIRGETDALGRYVNGLRRIDPEESKIVERIFHEYASGDPVSHITRRLNEEGVPSPRKGRQGKWTYQSICGIQGRGDGIIQKEIYKGVMIYNRSSGAADPRDGKRRYTQKPESEWIQVPMPHLRIVSDTLWQQAWDRRYKKGVPAKARPARTITTQTARKVEPFYIRPMTGLIKCGQCGGIKAVANHTRYVCANYRFFSGRCTNARGLREHVIQNAVMDALRGGSDDAVQRIVRALRRDAEGLRTIDKQIEALNHSIERFLDAIGQGFGDSKKFAARIAELEEEIKVLRGRCRRLSASRANEKTVRKRLLKALGRLQEEFDEKSRAKALKPLLEAVIEKIVCTPIPNKPRGETVEVVLKPSGWPEFYRLIRFTWTKVF